MRFRLRTLFAIVGFIALVTAIATSLTRDARKRYRIESELRSIGACYVAFDEDSEPRWVSFHGRIRSPRISDYQSLADVDLAMSEVRDEDLRFLVGLSNLKTLHLTDTAITDEGLVHISKIESLQIVRLQGTRVTDDGIELLARLPNLKGVDLKDTGVTPHGVELLQSLRPEIGIRTHTPPRP